MLQLPYIGAKLSLLTKSEERYEGTLYKVNAQEAIVALKDVKACGTEGRRKDGPQIHPNPTAFEYVVFKRADIKAIVVIEVTAQEAAAFEDPAILYCKSSSNFNSNSNNDNYTRQHQRHNNYDNNRRYQGNCAPARARVDDGKYLMHAQLWNATASANESDKGEFDFAKNLEKFDKEAELAKLTSDESGDNARRGEEKNITFDKLLEANVTYSKSSFYDDLSNEISDREAGQSTKLFDQEERQLNQETFGATGVQTHHGHRSGEDARRLVAAQNDTRRARIVKSLLVNQEQRTERAVNDHPKEGSQNGAVDVLLDELKVAPREEGDTKMGSADASVLSRDSVPSTSISQLIARFRERAPQSPEERSQLREAIKKMIWWQDSAQQHPPLPENGPPTIECMTTSIDERITAHKLIACFRERAPQSPEERSQLREAIKKMIWWQDSSQQHPPLPEDGPPTVDCMITSINERIAADKLGAYSPQRNAADFDTSNSDVPAQAVVEVHEEEEQEEEGWEEEEEEEEACITEQPFAGGILQERQQQCNNASLLTGPLGSLALEKSMFPCLQCDQTFASADALHQHQQAVHKVEIIMESCDYCMKTFPNSARLLQHKKDAHSEIAEALEKSMFPRLQCDQTFASADALHQHQQAVHKVEIIMESCDYCMKTFPNSARLLQHKKDAHSEIAEALEKSMFPCLQCDQTFASADALHQHQQAVHKVEIIMESCDYCMKTFSNSARLLQHKKDAHSEIAEALGKSMFPCLQCDLTFASAGALHQHQQAIHKVEIIMESCDYCMKTFPNSARLLQHKKDVHNEIARTQVNDSPPLVCPDDFFNMNGSSEVEECKPQAGQQQRACSKRVRVLWDIENVQIPAKKSPFSAARALQQVADQLARELWPNESGNIPCRVFAFHNPARQTLKPSVRKELVNGFVTLIDIGQSKIGSADLQIKLEMEYIAQDFPPENVLLVLVSSDSDFVPEIRRLGTNGFSIASIRQDNGTDLNSAAMYHAYSWRVLDWNKDVMRHTANKPPLSPQPPTPSGPKIKKPNQKQQPLPPPWPSKQQHEQQQQTDDHSVEAVAQVKQVLYSRLLSSADERHDSRIWMSCTKMMHTEQLVCKRALVLENRIQMEIARLRMLRTCDTSDDLVDNCRAVESSTPFEEKAGTDSSVFQVQNKRM